MRSVKCLLLAFLFFAAVLPGRAQERFNNCTAAFLDDKIVVDQYNDQGKCMLRSSASGMLSVCTAELSVEASVAVDKIPFRLAIRDGRTGTLVSFSEKSYRQIDIRKVTAKCQPGDHIVLLTLSDRYFLPHNEILVF